MHKVWHRAFDGWWYVTLTESARRQQIKLVRAPNDKDSKVLAGRQAVQELAARQHAEEASAESGVPTWATAGHVVRAFLKHSWEEHSAETAAWYKNLIEPFVDLFGKVWVESLWPQASQTMGLEKIPEPVRELLLTTLAPAA